jgi:ATP-dependent Clp protease ATP-binding subunit ClpC
MLKKELKKFFAPEFLNRIDEVVIFNTLKRDEVKQIVKLEMDKLCERLVKLKYNITYDESVLDLISEVGFDETYGARPLKRAIQDKVEDFISEEVLKGTVLEDVSYVLYVDNTDVKLKTVKKIKKKKGES